MLSNDYDSVFYIEHYVLDDDTTIYTFFRNLENFVKCTIIYTGIYAGAPLYL